MAKQRCASERLNCHLKPGMLSTHLEIFLQDLRSRGYTALTADSYAASVSHFAHWAQRRHLTLNDLSDEMLVRFAQHRCRCPGGRRQGAVSPKYVRRVRRFVRHLRAAGLIAFKTTARSSKPEMLLVEEFVNWLREHRGIGPRTLCKYRDEMAKFPSGIQRAEKDFLTATRIRALILKRAKQQGSSANRILLGTLRMYIRFLAATGRCTAGLEGAIPSMPSWRLSSLPRYLPAEQV